MLAIYIIVSICTTLVMVWVMRHPQPPLVPPKHDNRPVLSRIHRPHILPHIRRPRHDN